MGENEDIPTGAERFVHKPLTSLKEVFSETKTFAAGPSSRSSYTDWLTPIEEFYVLNHYPPPLHEEDDWPIQIVDGDQSAITRTVTELRDSYPEITVAHTMECAGNGRSAFGGPDQDPITMQWECNGVSNGLWTGTPISLLMKDLAPAAEAEQWVTFFGADAPEGEEVFARSIPMSKIMDDCILAYEMNGEELPVDHGYPVRLVVPGWYGVNCVKWVDEIRVMDTMVTEEKTPGHAKYQQVDYRLVVNDEEPISRETIDEFDTEAQMSHSEIEHPFTFDQTVMSMIGHPANDAEVSIRSDDTVEFVGVSWAGDDIVESVEISIDDGETWHEAEFLSPQQGRGSWRLFRCLLELQPGQYTAVSRATDEHGRTQPAGISTPGSGNQEIKNDAYPWNVKGHGNNAYLGYATEFTVNDK